MEETLKQFTQEYSKKDMNEVIEDIMMYSKKYHSNISELKRFQETYDNEKLVQEHNTGQNIAIATLQSKVDEKEKEVIKKQDELDASKQIITTKVLESLSKQEEETLKKEKDIINKKRNELKKLLQELDEKEEEVVKKITETFERKREDLDGMVQVKATNNIRSLECANKQLTELKNKLEILKKAEIEKLEKRLPRPVIIAKHKIEELTKDMELIKSKLDILEQIKSKRTVKIDY